MICKYCFAELEDGTAVCPICGKELETPVEETAQEEVAEVVEEVTAEEVPVVEKKKSNAWKKVLAIAGVAVLAIVLVGAILHFMGLGKQVVHNLQFWRANDIDYKLSYTVKNEVAEKKQNDVIATVGSQTLTNGEFQAHYWMAVYDFLDYYGYYLSSIGVDINKPLSEQIYDEKTGKTYQQMFMEGALDSWYRYATLVELSKEAGFQLNEEQQKYVDNVKAQVEAMAVEYKYADVEDFIDKEFFPGCSLDIYMKYTQTNYQALSYYDTLYEGLVPTQEQIETYYTEHEAEFAANKTDKSAGNYYDVRHILLGHDSPADSEGNYTDDQWQICLDQAQTTLNDFLAGEATEDAFAKLAMDISEDPGSAENGGLYSQLTKDTGFIEDFKKWYLDENRKPGDTGLVKNTESSVQGYHIMYFVGSYPIWEYEAKSALLTENTNKLIADGQAKWPMEVNYKKIVLGEVDLAG